MHQGIGVGELTATRKKGSTMKRITLAAIAATTLVILYAGKDDLRRFRRMYSM
jgi:hypothetical protein